MKKLIACAVVALSISSPVMAKEKIIATVDGVAITESQVDQFINGLPQQYDSVKSNKEFKEKIVQYLIDQQVLLNEAKAKGIDKRADVKKAIENAKNQIIANALIKEAVLKKEVNVSDKEISDYYNANKDSFKDTKGNPVPLATVKPYIKQKLLAEKQKKAIEDYINSLKKTHKVKYAK